MKLRFVAALLTLTLILMTFSGCTLIAAEAQLDAAEDALEQRAEQVEEQVETAVKDAVIPDTHNTQKAPEQAAGPKPEVSGRSTQLTEEEAKQIALQHANVKSEEAERMYVEYEIDDRVPQYDVHFHVGHVEYEYEIHTETGDILSFDRDDD